MNKQLVRIISIRNKLKSRKNRYLICLVRPISIKSKEIRSKWIYSKQLEITILDCNCRRKITPIYTKTKPNIRSSSKKILNIIQINAISKRRTIIKFYNRIMNFKNLYSSIKRTLMWLRIKKWNFNYSQTVLKKDSGSPNKFYAKKILTIKNTQYTVSSHRLEPPHN